MEWRQFKQAVVNAINANDIEELDHLFRLDPRWYADAIEEIEEGRV